MKSDIENLQGQLEEVKNNYYTLLDEHNAMKAEYSENTIVQSMNDMKNKYENMLKTTVQRYKYDNLEEKHDKICRQAMAVTVLIDHVVSSLKRLESKVMMADKTDIYKTELELAIMKELLEVHLKN
jgi:predicted nuclease with TOPRIM domain